MIKYGIKLAVFIGFSLFLISCHNLKSNEEWIYRAIERSESQIRKAAETYSPHAMPRSYEADGKVWLTSDMEDWTIGFFPGTLWYMYEITSDDFFLQKAELYTESLDSVKYVNSHHDLGFMLFCSYGNGYRLLKKEAYAKEIIAGTETLSKRFNPIVGGIRSWDWGSWEFPIIIDNLMNLEMMLWAAEYANVNEYRQMAVSHADITLKNHFRKDLSAYHVMDYDTITGNAKRGSTHQGYSDESTWARGQGWALYSYTFLYEMVKKEEYLKMAKNIADFIIHHPRLPKDAIPYWDFDHPDIPYTYRDASAAAIYASALLNLYKHVDEESSEEYFSLAEKILITLSSNEYLSEADSNGYFILKHSVGNLPAGSEIDASINYADYYYLEALIKYMKEKKISYKK